MRAAIARATLVAWPLLARPVCSSGQVAAENGDVPRQCSVRGISARRQPNCDRLLGMAIASRPRLLDHRGDRRHGWRGIDREHVLGRRTRGAVARGTPIGWQALV
ncbi:MAG: hypothetical protein H0X45_08340 [Planctomycetes bacterium]|nr:hypothetical protein [Planctomycetota bacterium]